MHGTNPYRQALAEPGARGVDRREFVRICTMAAAAVGLGSTAAARFVEAATNGLKPSVIWLHFADETMRAAIPVMAMLLALLPAAAETVTIEASRDATLIEDSDGSLANGAGPVFFAGRTAQLDGGTRRALVRFDVAAALPHRAVVEDVSLTLYMTPSNPDRRAIRLYRVLADWGEGPSSSSGGGGAAAESGDATWLHTFWDTDFWVHSGGQFLGRPSSELEVFSAGFYTWTSGRHLVRDVRLWKAAPERNFGWILIGDETARQTAKSFASREHAEPAFRPALRITYRLPGGFPERDRIDARTDMTQP